MKMIERVVREDMSARLTSEGKRALSDISDMTRADLVTEIERLREKCDKQARILQHAYPQRSGNFFVSGHAGVLDRNGLPEAVSICPAYGADWTVLYKRVDQ